MSREVYVRVLADPSAPSNEVPSGQYTTEGKYVYWDDNSGFTGQEWYQTVDHVFGDARGPLYGMSDTEIEEYLDTYPDLTEKFREWNNNPSITDTERSNWINYVENMAPGCVVNVD